MRALEARFPHGGASEPRAPPEDAWYCHRCWDEAFETSLEEAQASPYEATRKRTHEEEAKSKDTGR